MKQLSFAIFILATGFTVALDSARAQSVCP